ncbi:hypothetical protein L1049_001707 [Liquidambar formosana]|uniref:Uncharacterized protein n=1 Tax=Liquidambar formosana TaxID=63359 RepID=A0AAP0QXV7_LIQFO
MATKRAELQIPNSTIPQVIGKFVARLTGRLREWWIVLDYSPEAFIAIGYSPSAFDIDESDDALNIQTLLPIEPLEILPSHPIPIAQVQIVLEPYAQPISVIALFNTSASAIIMNLKVLSPHFWLPHHQMFHAVNKETFLIDKISKHILIRVFPHLVLKHQVLGSSLTGKELLIGFDLFHRIPNLR